MTRNFYHGKDADIVSGSANFAAKLTASAAGLGITPAQASAFSALNTVLQEKYAATTDPATRTSAAIEGKNEAVKAMRNAAIPLAKQIAGNPAVSNETLIELRLLPRTSPTPIPPTMTPPELEITGVNGRLVTGRVRQAAPFEGKARPAGSAGAQIYTFVGPSAPADPSAYDYQGLATRNKFEVLFPDDVPSGSTAWVAAAWVSQRGERGFACPPQQVTIQGGPVLAGEGA